MLPSLAILLPFAAFLPLGLTVPSPRGGGGFHVSGGGGGGTGLALAGLTGVIVANAQNGYSIDGSDPPDSGYGASSTCTYNGGNATDSAATDPAWISSMTGCLNALNGTNWNGNECAPPVGGVTFGFWKGENDYDDPVDCYQRCVGCLSTAINASQAVTTKCQYEYSTHRAVVGYKTHTCTMGFDAGT
ncbi:MAG: hypothetical protein Q9161_005105 [Pseudevernia consocians]